MIDELRTVFERLGYHSEPVDFNKAIPYVALRERLQGPFAGTDVSRVLRHLPDLFVMNHKMIHGIFFVKTLAEQGLSDEARDTYEKYYPKDILLVTITVDDEVKRILCRWIDEEDKETSLINSLKARFNFAPPKTAIAALRKDGWLV